MGYVTTEAHFAKSKSYALQLSPQKDLESEHRGKSNPLNISLPKYAQIELSFKL